MAKGYWIVNLDVHDLDAYNAYVGEVGPYLAEIGAKTLVRSTRFEVPEGQSRSLQVVVEFDTYELAVSTYHSDAYQRLMTGRLASSVANFVVAEGA